MAVRQTTNLVSNKRTLVPCSLQHREQSSQISDKSSETPCISNNRFDSSRSDSPPPLRVSFTAEPSVTERSFWYIRSVLKVIWQTNRSFSILSLGLDSLTNNVNNVQSPPLISETMKSSPIIHRLVLWSIPRSTGYKTPN